MVNLRHIELCRKYSWTFLTVDFEKAFDSISWAYK